MGLNIKNADVERLAAEVAALAGETKTEAIRKALEDRKQRLATGELREGRVKAFRYLREQVWPNLSEEQRRPLSKEEEENILGMSLDA